LALGTMLRLITSVVQFSDMLETKNAYCHEWSVTPGHQAAAEAAWCRPSGSIPTDFMWRLCWISGNGTDHIQVYTALPCWSPLYPYSIVIQVWAGSTVSSVFIIFWDIMSVESEALFRRNISPLSSGSYKQRVSRCQAEWPISAPSIPTP
jgi:hypothetical protein